MKIKKINKLDSTLSVKCYSFSISYHGNIVSSYKQLIDMTPLKHQTLISTKQNWFCLWCNWFYGRTILAFMFSFIELKILEFVRVHLICWVFHFDAKRFTVFHIVTSDNCRWQVGLYSVSCVRIPLLVYSWFFAFPFLCALCGPYPFPGILQRIITTV